MGIFVPTDDQAQMENLTSNGHFELACAISRWTAFWLVLSTVIFPAICENNSNSKFVSWFTKQTRQKKLEYCSCIIGFLHGSTAAVSSVLTICFSTSLSPENLTSHSPWLEWQFKLTTGYFISDTIQMYMQGPGCTHRTGFVAHHVLCAVAVYTTLHTSVGYFFIGFKMMTELSTPFMNISLMMEMANFKGSKFYYLNGHFFYWTFFLSRPLLILPYWLYVYEHLQNMENLLSTMSAAHLIVNLMLSVCLDCLNLYWTIFLSKDYYRRLTETRPTQTTANDNKKLD